jgi:hypothetical protein
MASPGRGGEAVLERVKGELASVQAQDAGESAFADFDDDAGVMCNESAQNGVGVVGVA